MMYNIQQLYQKLMNIGIDDELDFEERIRIKVLNLTFMVTFIINIILIPILLIYRNDYMEVQGVIIIAAVIAGMYWMNSKKTYKVILYVGLSFSFLLSFVNYLLVGGFNGGTSLCIVGTQIVLFVSKRKYAGLIIFVSISLYLAVTFYIQEYGVMTNLGDTAVHPIGYLLGGSMLLLLINSLFDKENEIENKKIQKNNSLTAKQNEELDRFKYIISHDLREPIRSILSFSNLLKKYENQPEKQLEFSQNIIHSGKQLEQLINGIKGFQEVDQLDVDLDEIHIPSMIEDIKVVLDTVIHRKHAEIICDVNIPKIKTSHYAMLSVLKNLIENGIRFNNSEAPVIEIWSEIFQDNFLLYIRDNGLGIEKKYFEDIFIMFNKINTNDNNAGLGLNIARKTIKKLGGNIEIAYSKLGAGSTFAIVFPTNILVDQIISIKNTSISKNDKELVHN